MDLILRVKPPELVRAVLDAGGAAGDRRGRGGAGPGNLCQSAAGQGMGLLEGKEGVLIHGKDFLGIPVPDGVSDLLSGAHPDGGPCLQVIDRENQLTGFVI